MCLAIFLCLCKDSARQLALRLVTKIDGNADLYSGGRPVAPSFSSSRFECGSLCLQLQAKKKGSMGL